MDKVNFGDELVTPEEKTKRVGGVFTSVARNYDLSYRAGVYDFDVHMEVEMTKFEDLLVPKVLRYNGKWDVVLKKREQGAFTATLFDFTR